MELLWNTILNINSALCAIACGYLVYAAGASIYYVTWRPLELGVVLVVILICTEVVFAAIEEVAGR
ncbi:MAG TPA: hypothetical protein VG102_03985 [Candidatus Paceibacterota bacterium]|jgi:hypothetical protein|nr:hypothetical protein [Candidatus Paceibacterota bacterium]